MSGDPEFERASALFLELRALQPPAREAALARLDSQASPECAALVRRLLSGDGDGAALERIEREVGAVREAVAAVPAADGLPFEQLGPYRLIAKVGEGGMGSVYEARQLEPVVRRVALKLVRPGLDSAKVAARFQAERQTLARMDHPHIAKVFDAGESPEGLLYFAMEFVEGPTLTAYVTERRLGLEARLRLFCDLCDAVRHAHQKGVVHRDLKPSNVLVPERDGLPHLQVIDFGIAKVLEEAERSEGVETQAAELLGTPLYMSPEQARGSLDVDTRSDVYALGILLFELLTGATPVSRDELNAAGPLGMAELLSTRETPRPSAHGELPPGLEASRLRGDLDWIVLRASALEPARRYSTADALAADVRRFLAHEPVEARPPSLGYTATKFARRHRLGLASAALVAVALLAGSVVAVLALRRERDALAELVAETAENDRYFAAERTSAALRAIRDGNADAARALLDAIPEGDRGFEWHWAHSALVDAGRPLNAALELGSSALAARDDRAATVDAAGQAWLCGSATPDEAPIALGAPDALDVAFLPDGSLALLRADGVHELWSSGGRLQSTERAPGAVPERWLVGPDRLYSLARTGAAHVWTLDLEPAGAFDLGQPLAAAALSPDGRWLGAIRSAGGACLFDAATLEQAAEIPTDPRGDESLTFTADSRLLLVGGMGGTVRAIDPRTTEVLLQLRASALPIRSLCALDDRRFLAGALDGTVTEGDARSGELRSLRLASDRGPTHIVDAGSQVLFAYPSSPPAAWNRADLIGSTRRIGHEQIVFEVTPVDGRGGLASADGEGRLCLWEPEGERPCRVLELGPGFLYGVVTDATHRTAVTYGSDRVLRAWSLPEWSLQWSQSAASGVRNVALSPDGRLLAGPSIERDPTGSPVIALWDVAAGTERLRLTGSPGEQVFRVAFDAAGTRLAAPYDSGETWVWDTTTGERLLALPARPDARANAVAFSPDGARLYTGHGDGRLCAWDATTGAPLWDAPAHLDVVGSVEVSSDGGRVLTSGWYNGAVHLWDAATGRRRLTLETGIPGLSDASFGADGRSITAAGMEGGLRTWRVRGGIR